MRLLQVQESWTVDNNFMCTGAENGQYLALEMQFTTLPALADSSEGTYTFIGWELGALDASGAPFEEANAFSGLFCLDQSQQAPSEMQPGQTYTGWAVLDVPADVSAVTWTDLFDFTGEAPSYRWVLADQ
ncbi:MAG: hypothetical protein JJE50_09070 [Actinomycetales bacterium]|nr:hypothetical protein [Actinomycetales bacterium]